MLGIVLTGCATTGGYEYEGHRWAQLGEHKIITKNNDLYIEKIDGSESRRLTHTPELIEGGRFVSGGKYFVYNEIKSYLDTHPKYYIMPTDGDDSQRKEISLQEFENLR